MTRLRAFLSRLTALVGRRRLDRDLEDEIAGHLAEATDEFIRQGLSPDAAHRAALRSFGGVTQTKEIYRQVRSFGAIDALQQDLRYTVRGLVKSPLFTAVVVLTLAFGIGANTALFSILNALLLRSLPVREPERLVHVTDSILRDTGETRVRAWSYPVWEQIRERSQRFGEATAWSFTRFNLAPGGEARFADGIWADGNFFEMLGVAPAVGRTFSPRDDRPGGGPDGPVTVISYGCWQRLYGGAPDVVGRSATLSGVPFTIVGVSPPGFFGPEVGRSFDFVIPLRTEALIRGKDSVLGEASSNFLTILARLPLGQSQETAAAELRRLQPEIRTATIRPWSPDVVDRFLTSPFTVVPAAAGYSNLRSSYQRPVLVLSVTVGLVLLIGCLNVANLLLARASSRHHELSVRLALGASRARLVRQLFAESLTLSAIGAALGMSVAIYGSRFLVRQLSTVTSTVFLDLSIDRSVLAFAVAVTAVTTLIFGTAPALRASRVAPIDAIREHGRTASRSGGLIGWLVAVQVALSLVLVVAAGLFIRSFTGLTNRTLGLEPDRVLVVTLGAQRVPVDAAQRQPLYEQVRHAVRGLPNVAAAGVSQLTPAGGGGFTPAILIADDPSANAPGQPQLIAANQDVFGNLVSPGWFDTFGMRVIAGRELAERDVRGAPRAMVVNEAFVRRYLGRGSPIGRMVTIYPNTPRALAAQIVGVAEDAIYGSPREAVPATWYLPMAQFDVPGFSLASARLSVRAESGSPALLGKSVAAAVTAVNPQLVLTVRPLADQIRGALTRERLMAHVAGVLGALALLLAALGLHGVAAQAIAQRRTEIAIRLALGAAPRAVVALVVSRAALLVALGLLAGAGISVWTAQFVSGLIYGFPVREPAMLVGAAAILIAVGLIAVWLPARHATRLDPLTILRDS